MRALAVLLVGGGLLAAWAGQGADRPEGDWQAPREAAARMNPLAATPEIVGGGRKLFIRHCAECHRGDGQGGRRGADLLLPTVQEQADGALFWKITNGNQRRGMPSWGRLPEPQRWQLVLYVRALQTEFSRTATSK